MQLIYPTNRLYLKILDETSAPEVLDYYKRNQKFLEPWEPTKGPGFYTKSYQRTLLAYEYKNIINKSSLRLWLFHKDIEHKVIGSISFSNIIRGVLNGCTLGYKLDHAYVNQGYITEALKEGIRIIFNDYHIHRIEANIMPINSPSIRVITKLGFHYEGDAIDILKINGNWETHRRYARINPLI